MGQMHIRGMTYVFIDEPLVFEGWRTAFFKLRRIEAERLQVSFKLCESVCLSRSG